LTSTDSKGQPNEAFGDVLDRAKQYVSNFTEAMRKGRFPVWPRSRSACRNCDFQEICRYAEWRIMRKWDANPIAELAIPADEAEAGEEDEP
ncbi:MAG: PD-(D/E)XK nuclease family protein, partial [Phycisphaerae bacterium]